MTTAQKIGKTTIKLLNTGVPGMDLVLGGGLPEFSFNLIAGQPGAGKTTLAHQIMFALATPELPALYFTVLGEPPIKMLRYQQQFDFFDLDKVNRAIRFINLSEDTATGDLEKVMARISAEVQTRGPGLVFIDSFRSVMLAGQGASRSFLDLQTFIQNLGLLMTSWQATTFLIGEYFSESDPNPIFTVADGLIWLRQSAQGNSVVRKMEVVKMRGQSTLAGLHTFRMSAAGLQVFATPQFSLKPFNDSTALASQRMSTGVPQLDQMLGGGLPRGYSLLVAGPSGSGKSILAAQFLAEGARLGETGVIAAFEQRPNRSRGLVLADLIETGRVGVVDTTAGKKLADIKVDGDTLEAMALEKSGPKIYVNNRDKNQVDVVDREKRAVVASWPVTKGKPTIAMGFDEANHRLFVACRSGDIVVMDTQSGKEIKSLPITKGVDDMVYDAASKRIYSAADGSVDVYQQIDPDNYKLLATVPTGPLGKTARLVPEISRYFVAVPQHGTTNGSILVFAVQ